MELVLRRSAWILMTVLCALLAIRTLHYFGNNPAAFFQPDIYLDRMVVLRFHIAGGVVAALSGPLQFWGGFRNRHRSVHRALGKLYIVGVLIGSAFGLAIATTALGGLVTQAGFSALTLLWASTTLMAYRRIRLGDIAGHRRWMVRSFALTFAFVTLRVIFPTLQFGVGFDQTTAFQITAWACWIPNLLIVEIALRIRDVPRWIVSHDVGS